MSNFFFSFSSLHFVGIIALPNYAYKREENIACRFIVKKKFLFIPLFILVHACVRITEVYTLAIVSVYLFTTDR